MDVVHGARMSVGGEEAGRGREVGIRGEDRESAEWEGKRIWPHGRI